LDSTIITIEQEKSMISKRLTLVEDAVVDERHRYGFHICHNKGIDI
jgi:hypothetical protein